MKPLQRLGITLCTSFSVAITVVTAIPSWLLDSRTPDWLKRPLLVFVGVLALSLGCWWGHGFYKLTLDARHGPVGVYLTMETFSALIGFFIGYLAALMATLGVLKMIMTLSDVWRRQWNICAAKAGILPSDHV